MAFTAEERRQYIGASDAAAVVGLSRWRTPLEVWGEKTGNIVPEDISGKPCVFIGTELEEAVAKLYTRETGKKVRRVKEARTHAKHPFIKCHLDRIVEGEPTILQIKTAGASHAKEWDEGIPPEYYIQELHELACYPRAARAEIAVLIGNNDFRVKTIERSAVKEEIAGLIEKEAHFWNSFVVPKVMPMLVGAADAGPLSKLYPRGEPGASVDLAADAKDIIAAIQEKEALIKSLKDEVEAKKNLLKVAIGDAEVGLTDGYKVKWSNESRTLLNTDALKDGYPELWAAYSVVTNTRRLTISKDEKKEKSK